MTLRTLGGLWVAVAVIVLPIIIAQAQAEGEAEPAAEVEATAEEGTDIEVGAAAQEEVATAGQPEDTASPAAQEGSILGAEAVAHDEEEVAATEPNGEVAAAANGTTPETAELPQGSTDEAPATETTATTTSPGEPTITETGATSTTSTVDPPAVPIEEPFVLQPAVKLHVNGSSVAADISLDNLTCKRCGKVLPALSVKAYYTTWYPNDGPEYKEAGAHLSEQEVNVSDVGLWSSRAMSWSANDIAPGRYYFVIVVDPENTVGAYYRYRTEFAI